MTQCEKVLDFMKNNTYITVMDAVTYLRITSLHRRLAAIEKQGYPIKRDPCRGINRFGEPVRYKKYSLIDGVNENV